MELLTVLYLVLTGLLALHFSDNFTPLWSDVSRGGTTVQDDNVDKSEISSLVMYITEVRQKKKTRYKTDGK